MSQETQQDTPKTATAIKPFTGTPDRDIYPIDYAIGAQITGDLADVAVRNGWATWDEVQSEPQEIPAQEPALKKTKKAPEPQA